MGELAQTSLDPSTIGTYLDTAVAIKRDHIYRVVIRSPLVHGTSNDPRGSVLIPRINLIRDLAARAFPSAGPSAPGRARDDPEDSAGPTKTKLPAVTCAAPTPTPGRAPKADSRHRRSTARSRGDLPKPTPTIEPTQPPATPESPAP